MKLKQIFLLPQDAETLRQYCKGCQFFKPEKEVRGICSIIGWYDDKSKNNMAQIVAYVKRCPCNKKCLVKAACREEQCPEWMNYVENLGKKRLAQSKKRWSKKNSHVKNASS